MSASDTKPVAGSRGGGGGGGGGGSQDGGHRRSRSKGSVQTPGSYGDKYLSQEATHRRSTVTRASEEATESADSSRRRSGVSTDDSKGDISNKRSIVRVLDEIPLFKRFTKEDREGRSFVPCFLLCSVASLLFSFSPFDYVALSGDIHI